MGIQMSLLVAAGEFGPKRVRAVSLRAEDLDKAVFTFDTEDGVEKEKIDLVLSQVSCDRSKAINALLSNGNDVGEAVSFLQTFFEVLDMFLHIFKNKFIFKRVLSTNFKRKGVSGS